MWAKHEYTREADHLIAMLQSMERERRRLRKYMLNFWHVDYKVRKVCKLLKLDALNFQKTKA